jgi:predicted permease
VVLVAGAGLFLRSYYKLATLDPGFDPRDVTVAAFSPGGGHGDSAALEREYTQALGRLRALPGAVAASQSSLVPAGGVRWMGIVHTVSQNGRIAVAENVVGPAFFAAMKTPVLAGRAFNAGDRIASTPVAIVNQTLARQIAPQGNALGSRLLADKTQLLVVGISQDARYAAMDEDVPPTLYLAMAQSPPAPSMRFEVRSHLGDAPGAVAVRGALLQLDPNSRVTASSMSQNIHDALAQPRLLAMIAGLFGGLGLLLTGIGLYGVISYDVGRRTGEIGIRMALGAAPTAIGKLIGGEYARLLAWGTGVGAVAAWMAARAAQASIHGLLYRIAPQDLPTIATAVGAHALVALAAAARPALRAARTDPMASLREN